MAKAPLGHTQPRTPETLSDPAESGSVRAEQAPAEYTVVTSQTPASIIPQGAAGAWLLYRNQFLNSSARMQISEIRKGAPASNLMASRPRRPSASWPGTKRSIR